MHAFSHIFISVAVAIANVQLLFQIINYRIFNGGTYEARSHTRALKALKCEEVEHTIFPSNYLCQIVILV